MSNFTLKEHLLTGLRSVNPSKTMLSAPGCTISAGKLIEDIESLGTALYAHGFRGKRVAAVAGNHYEYVIVLLAAVCGKMTLVPLYEGWSAYEKEEFLRRTDAAVCFEEYQNISELIKEGHERIIQGDRTYLDEILSPTDVSMILFTSGTTGMAKGVPFQQQAWQPYVVQIPSIGWNEATLGQQILALPLFHLFAVALLIAFFCEGISVILSEGFQYFASEIQTLKPKALFLVPAQVNLLYQLMKEEALLPAEQRKYSSLERIIYSGSGLSQELFDNFHSLGVVINSAYSMTETSGIAFDPYDLSTIKRGSSGRILPDARPLVCIDKPDRDGGGELLVSKAYVGVFEAYLDDPEETDKILVDGWLHTGDLARIDDDGDLFITGRIKNLIILSNGENVSPEKLEQEVMKLPGVRECLVYEEDDSICVKIVPIDWDEGGSPEKTYTLFKNRVYEMNRRAPAFEHIGRITLCESLEKSASGKLLRT